ncbi:MAG: hypothetical protein AB9866_25965 [Syntrophobacteraceae bacterium]
MAGLSWKMKVTLVLIAASAVLAILHVLIFRDATTFFFYIALDIAFVPIQVLLVTVLIERLLSEREKQNVMRKLNMIIGAFFGEVGSRLIKTMGAACVDFTSLEEALSVSQNWRKNDYEEAAKFIAAYECRLDSEKTQLGELKSFLLAKRDFMLGFLQNPTLLEHDEFTDLLWAICHLTEELEARNSLDNLPSSDIRHIQNDMQRAFDLLVREWLAYMQHLRKHYPYMHSLSVRTNPFNPNADPVVLDG